MAKTVEEAIENWNTWLGRYKDPSLEAFKKANPCNECSRFIDDKGNYRSIDNNELFSDKPMYFDGTFKITWPLLPYLIKSTNIKETYQDIISYRARWCALFVDVNHYRERIVEILRNNDRENNYLNDQLKSFNEYLVPHGFRQFDNNDLRGINLAALDLGGDAYQGIFLRNVNLSYSDLTYSILTGANLYGSILFACEAHGIDLSFSVVSNVNFSNSMFSSGKFICSDACSSNFNNAVLYNAVFNGSKMENSSCLNANFSNASFCEHMTANGISKICSLRNIIINSSTNFKDVIIRDNTIRIDKKVQEEILSQNSKNFWDAVDLKPGWLGFSIDLKEIFRRIKGKIKKRR